MKNKMLFFIILALAISIPCYTKEISIRKLAEFEEYQGYFHLAGNGFVSVSNEKGITNYVWDKKQNDFKKTNHKPQILYLDLPRLQPQKNDRTTSLLNIWNSRFGGVIVCKLIIPAPKLPSRIDPNRDFYIEFFWNGKNVFKSKMMNGVVEKFLGVDLTKDSEKEVFLEYVGVGGSGFTSTLVIFKVDPGVLQ